MSTAIRSIERIVTVGKNFLAGFSIEAPVGDWNRGARNIPTDVETVQLLLEQVSKLRGQIDFNPRGVDGKISRTAGNSNTVKAIRAYQRGFMASPDGLIDPGGQTLRKLHEDVLGTTPKAKDATRSVMQAPHLNDGNPPWLYAVEGQQFANPAALLPQGGASEPDWISIAEQELGVDEVEEQDKQRIGEYHLTTKNQPKKGKKALAEETPWCSSFVNWVMQQAGYAGTNSRSSHSWKDWGDGLAKPAVGSIAFIDWGKVYPDKEDKKGKGHVGFVMGKTDKGRIVLLGGNQGDKVQYSAFKQSIIVSYRVPKGFEVDPSLYDLPVMKVTGGGSSFEATR